MSALPSNPSANLLQKLSLASPRSLSSIRSQDPCSCNQPLADLELLSLYLYTTEDRHHSYLSINEALAAGNGVVGEIGLQIQSIDGALNQLSPFIGDCYRTEQLHGRIHSKVNNLLKLGPLAKGVDAVELSVDFFMSTSLDKNLGLRGSAVEIVIVGASAGRDISHLSHYPDEREILFQRQSRFLILDVEVDAAKGSYVIYLGEL